jgi:predicted anti-sigma-YlaC factor YlaD
MTMSCSEFVELVTDYLEGRMSAEKAERFDAHMEVCPPCQYYLDQMRTTLLALGRIPEETISNAARAELLHAFTDYHSHER